MLIWLTGLSGAGKSTIANEIVRVVKPYLPELVMIDGDVVRDLFGAGLGFDEDARKQQITRIQRLALFLSRQNIPVIVAALYSNSSLLTWNRDNLPGYFEIYVDTPLDIVEERDTKGLYSKARAGQMAQVVGIDVPWHPPTKPDMVVYTHNTTPEFIARTIIQAVPRLFDALDKQS